MGESPRVAKVHVVEGRPWKDALIKILAPACPYRPWHHAQGIVPGDAVIVVLDTDPPSVLNGVGIVAPDGNVEQAIDIMTDHQSSGLLDVGTLQMLTDVALGTRMGPVHGHRSFDDVVAAIGERRHATSDALFGHTSLAAGRVLLESGCRCAGCHRQLDLDGEDAREHVHIHTADPPVVVQQSADQRNVADDWPAVLCDLCHTGMRQGGFANFLASGSP